MIKLSRSGLDDINILPTSKFRRTPQPGTEKRPTCINTRETQFLGHENRKDFVRDQKMLEQTDQLFGLDFGFHQRGKNPGDWIISSEASTSIADLNEGRSDREQEISGTEKVTADPPERTRYSRRDTVFYKVHHLSNMSNDFHAGLAPHS